MSERNLTERESSFTLARKSDLAISCKANNRAELIGIVEEEPIFDHETLGEKFYKTRVITQRDSGTEDYVPIFLSEYTIPKEMSLKGKLVEIYGEFRAYSYHEEDRNRKLLYLFVERIKYDTKTYDYQEILFKNNIFLEGVICNKPNLRITPLGSEIVELMLAVNRKKNKSDYIPCIAWNKTSRFVANNLNVGDRIKIYGRMQSRIYFKKFSPNSDEGEVRTAYEVSIYNLIVD